MSQLITAEGGTRPQALGGGTCPPDPAHRPTGLAPGFPGLRELLAVSPKNKLVKPHWWKEYAIFGGEPRKLWLGTWTPSPLPEGPRSPGVSWRPV